MLFGAHVSISGGIWNAPLRAGEIGCEVFQMFTRSPHGGPMAPITDEMIDEFKENCKAAGQKEWYVHTPYYINLASANNRIRYGSMNAIRQELERASQIKAKYVMTHLGSYKDLGREAGYQKLVEGLEKVLDGYEGSARFLIEISAGTGDIIGDTFEEIATVVHHLKLKKFGIGVCYDTQHGFASGYDIRTSEAVDATLNRFEATIGLDRLKLSHCNDSKVELGSRKDRHEHIGDGQIGLPGFRALLSDKRVKDINFILETAGDKVEEDLDILKDIRRTAG